MTWFLGAIQPLGVNDFRSEPHCRFHGKTPPEPSSGINCPTCEWQALFGCLNHQTNEQTLALRVCTANLVGGLLLALTSIPVGVAASVMFFLNAGSLLPGVLQPFVILFALAVSPLLMASAVFWGALRVALNALNIIFYSAWKALLP